MRGSSGFMVVVATAAAATPIAAWADPADDAAVSARAAADANRHADAIADFQRAIALAPDRRAEWLLELADQLTWSQNLDAAMIQYRTVMAGSDKDRARRARIGLARALSWAGQHDAAIREYNIVLSEQPADRDVALARAQVLGWANRLGDALASYDTLVERDPDDADARRGRARMLSWRGRYRAAMADTELLQAANPGDTEAAIIKAETLLWSGRPDRALPILEQQLALQPGDRQVVDRIDALRLGARPELRLDVRHYDQSDELGISEISISARIPIEQGRGSVGARLVRADYRPAAGAVSKISVSRPQLQAGYRINDALEVNGAIAVDLIRTRGTNEDFSPIAYEAYATLRPNDLVRIDVGTSRWTFDSEATLRGGLTATQYAASIDLVPDDRTTLSARASVADYTDGNRRTWWQLEASHRILNAPRTTLAYRLTGFDFRLAGQPGYYNPAKFVSHEAVLRSYGQFTPRLRWDVRVVGGVETETPGGSRFIVNAGASLTQALGRNVELEAGYDFSSSRSFSVGGFQRGVARLALRARF